MSSRSAARRQAATAGWRPAGQTLVRELSSRDFDEAIAFMCIVGDNRVRLQIANPNHAGITEAELRLADKVNAVVDST